MKKYISRNIIPLSSGCNRDESMRNSFCIKKTTKNEVSRAELSEEYWAAKRIRSQGQATLRTCWKRLSTVKILEAFIAEAVLARYACKQKIMGRGKLTLMLLMNGSYAVLRNEQQNSYNASRARMALWLQKNTGRFKITGCKRNTAGATDLVPPFRRKSILDSGTPS